MQVKINCEMESAYGGVWLLKNHYFCQTFCRVIRKFFPLDKNYLLEQAQLSLQDELLTALIEQVKFEYQLRENPLGLEDSFWSKVKNFKATNLKPLEGFYLNLAGIYRYKYGQNQLEFSWDGRDHTEKYQEEWRAAFSSWTKGYCQQTLFLNAVLDLTVFLPENRKAQLAENRMNHFVLQQFEVKIHKSKGIVDMKVA